MTASLRAPRDEAGFTLIELLVAITILGVISFALTESLILGFKTTDGTIAKVSRSAGVQLVEPYFTADARSAELVSTTDATCATEPVFLHLTWTDQGMARAVSYALDPPTGGEQDLIRWSCSGSGAPDRKILGHFTHDPTGPPPLTASCADVDCPATPPIAPPTITLSLQTDPSASPGPATRLVVRRRTT